MQDEVERVTNIIKLVHQKVREAAESAEKVILKHISSELVEEVKKTKEEVRQEPDRVTKILQYFQSKIGTSEKMKE